MPNYSLVVDSKFRPFSLQDMLVPVMMESNEHKKIQENLADLNEQANVWKGMISPENDPVANAMYQKYADDLAARADNLQKYGLNFASRQNMYEMKSRYKNEIQPIETAFNRRKELAKSQAEAISKDPTRMFQRDASKMSLDTFISDPEANYGWETSGALITSQVSQAAKALAKELRGPNGKGILTKLGIPYMWDYIHQHGFTSKEVLQAILRDKDASPVLTNLVEQVMQSSGVYGTGDAGLINKTREYANLGLYDAIGETTNQVLTDQYNMQTALRRDALKDQLDLLNPGRLEINTDRLVGKNAGEANAKADIQRINVLAKRMGFSSDFSKFGRTIDLKGMKGASSSDIYSFTDPTAHNGPAGSAGNADYNIYNKNGSTKFNLFTFDKGHLLSREDFIKQGRSSQDQKELGKVYDRIMSDLTDLVGPSKNMNIGWTTTEIGQRLSQAMDNAQRYGSAVGYDAIELPLKNISSVVEKRILPKLKLADRSIAMREIQEFNADGTIKFSSRRPKVSDFLDKNENLKNKNDVQLHSYTGQGEPGLILTLGTTNYLIDPQHLGSFITEVFTDANDLKAAYALREEYIGTYGEVAYAHSKVGQALDNAIDNMGSAFVRGTGTAITNTYDADPYKLNSPTK